MKIRFFQNLTFYSQNYSKLVAESNSSCKNDSIWRIEHWIWRFTAKLEKKHQNCMKWPSGDSQNVNFFCWRSKSCKSRRLGCQAQPRTMNHGAKHSFLIFGFLKKPGRVKSSFGLFDGWGYRRWLIRLSNLSIGIIWEFRLKPF